MNPERLNSEPAPSPSIPKAGSTSLEARYICDSCGEEIVVPIDVTGGSHQDYVEDCPVCCNPMVLHVDIDDAGEPHVESEHE